MNFSFKNYFKPTPKNLQRWVSAVKGITLAAAGTAWATGNPHHAAAVLIGGAVLDELSKFFAQAEQDEEKEGAGQASK